MTFEQLLEKARNTKMTDEQREAQRQSFAYGNTHFENEQITRETVKRASEHMKGEGNAPKQHHGGIS